MIADPLGGAERVNCYALVFYASGPLAVFLDELRAELKPGHPAPRSHVTVLPPRPLPDYCDPTAATERAIAQLDLQAAEFAPFDITLGELESFDGTNVVYLSVACGFEYLHQMHHRLNHGALQYDEPHPYHPHITLAQGLEPDQMLAAIELVRERWAAYKGPKSFPCREWYFVQGTVDLRWVDLAGMTLK